MPNPEATTVTLRQSGIAPDVMYSGPSFVEEAAVRQLRREKGESFVGVMKRIAAEKPRVPPSASRPKPTVAEVVEAHNARVLRQREADRLETEHREQVGRIKHRLQTAIAAHEAAQANYLGAVGSPQEAEARKAVAAARQDRANAEDLAAAPLPAPIAFPTRPGELKRSLNEAFAHIGVAERDRIKDMPEVFAALRSAFYARTESGHGTTWPLLLVEIFGSDAPRSMDWRAEREQLIAKYGVLE